MLVRRGLDKIAVYKPGKPIEEVKRALRLKKVYKLASNEIPFSPFYIRKVILRELENINRYPESACFDLRKTLAKKLRVREEQIVFGNGSDELITLTLRAVVEKGDEVVVAYPTFLIYEIQAKIQGAKVIRVPLKGFRYCLTKMAEKINRNTKLVFIANPDNPTGTYVTNSEVKNFLQKIPRSTLVYFDEAYFEFAPKDFPKTIEFLKKRGNIIFVRTFSKAFGLAGLRIGYGVTTKEFAATLNKIREPFNINRFAQVAALAALKNNSFLKKALLCIKREKEYLYEKLRNLNISFVESATNFILIDFKKDTKKLANYLLNKGVIIRQMDGWGLKNFFRVTIGTHKENEKFIENFIGYLKKTKR
jgi:histidinol-phosphate aminotransferase